MRHGAVVQRSVSNLAGGHDGRWDCMQAHGWRLTGRIERVQNVSSVKLSDSCARGWMKVKAMTRAWPMGACRSVFELQPWGAWTRRQCVGFSSGEPML